MDAATLPDAEYLTIERSGHVATVWLDRPDKLNAMAPSFWVDLPVVMDALSDDPGVRVVVIAGRGRAFTVGIDLEAFGPAMADGSLAGLAGGSPVAKRKAVYLQVKDLQRTFTSIAGCTKPVIAAIHGYCLGGGIDLITACDIRLASADAVFSVRETKMAMVADVGTMQRLPRIIDPGRVAEIVYTGKDFGAGEAAEMGLISHIYPDRDTVIERAREMADEIAANSPLAVQGSKWVLRHGSEMTVDQALDYIAVWNSSFLSSADMTEAITAYMQKRPPEFSGD